MSETIEFSWEVTNGCNLNCKHCLNNSGLKKKGELTYNEISKFIKSLDKRRKYSFKLTGGEPFFRDDILDIIKLLAKNKFDIEIITNGTLLNEEFLSVISKEKIKLGISIESFDKKTHEALRGKNTFKKLHCNIMKIKRMGIESCFYTTITKYNENQINEFIRESHRLGVPIHFNFLNIAGRAYKNREELVPEKSNIIDIIKDSYNEIYEDKIVKLTNCCWVDTSVFQLDSLGNIFYCTEINHTGGKPLGNVKTFSFNDWFYKNGGIKYKEKIKMCPYDVYISEKISIVSNTNKKCPLLVKNEGINSIEKFNEVFDKFYAKYGLNCNGCEYPDCMGYIWLLEDEIKKLYDIGVELLILNNDIHCINTLGSCVNSDTDLSKIVYPRCPLRCKSTKACKIHVDRPMVCHIYPLGLESSKSGTINWVLHKDCKFIDDLKKNGLFEIFMLECLKLINSLSVDLEKQIIDTFSKIDQISEFPNGENSYYIIKEGGK